MTNPALILLSNYSLEEVYKKSLSQYPSCLQPIYKRFLVVEATEPIDNLGLIEALVQALLATTAPPECGDHPRAQIPYLKSFGSSIIFCPAHCAMQCPSLDIAASTESASSATEEHLNALADGTPEPESSNSSAPTGALLALMTAQPEMQTVSAKPSKHDRFMEMRRKKIKRTTRGTS